MFLAELRPCVGHGWFDIGHLVCTWRRQSTLPRPAAAGKGRGSEPGPYQVIPSFQNTDILLPFFVYWLGETQGACKSLTLGELASVSTSHAAFQSVSISSSKQLSPPKSIDDILCSSPSRTRKEVGS